MNATGADLAILVPMLGRWHRVERLLQSAFTATPEATVWLLVSENDEDGRRHLDPAAFDDARVLATVVDSPAGMPGDYARKINAVAARCERDWILAGAIDLCFCPDWYTQAALVQHATGALVVGTNDLCNPRTSGTHRGTDHSTHPLFARSYIVEQGTADVPGRIYHEGYVHEFCNPPDAPIWMGDLTFRPLGDVREGDEVVGWERVAAGSTTLRRLTTAQVLSVRERRSSLVRVSMESGRSFRCTPDHRWLNALWTPAATKRWAAYPEFVEPRAGRSILHIVDPTEDVPAGLDRTAGYLAGIYDGEGSWIQIAQCRVTNPEVSAAIVGALNKLGIPHTIGSSTANFITLTGGRQAYVDFLNRVQPTKRWQIAGRILGGRRFGLRDRIVDVEAIPDGRVVSLATTTGNYVAWGYASRNCDDEAVRTARFRGVYAHAAKARVEHLHPACGKERYDAVYRQQSRRIAAGRAEFDRRKHLWGGAG